LTLSENSENLYNPHRFPDVENYSKENSVDSVVYQGIGTSRESSIILSVEDYKRQKRRNIKKRWLKRSTYVWKGGIPSVNVY
jgi:hypothetical protein